MNRSKEAALDGNGWLSMGKGAQTFVPDEEAAEYALERCGVKIDMSAPEAAEAREALVDWYYSGAWCRAFCGKAVSLWGYCL